MVYSTPDLNKDNGIKIREGWLYVYINGYLWRELEVSKNSKMHDVNLYTYHHQYDRKATVERDSRIVVPHKIDGKVLTVEMCYSEVQWGWDYIDSMGGMDPIDIRLGENAPDNSTSKTDAASNRTKCMTKITNLADSLSGYQGDDSAEIIHIKNVKDQATRLIHLKSKLGAVFLHDPVGIAKILKTEHLRTSFEYEKTKHYIATEEYSLAIFANELMAAEKNALQSDPAATKQVKADLNSTQLAQESRIGAFQNRSESDKNNIITDYKQQADQKYNELSEVRKVLDIDKINEAVDYWDELSQKQLIEQLDAGKKVVEFMDTETGISFDIAMMDYFSGNSSARVATGVGRLCFFIEYFDFEQGLHYISKLTKKENLIGKTVCSAKAIKDHQAIFIALEGKNLISFRPKVDEFKLDTDATRGLMLNSLNVFSKLLEGFSKVKLAEGKAGLEWLATLANNYLGSDLNIKVNEGLIKTLYNPPKHLSKNVVHFLDTTDSVMAKTTMNYISIEGRTPTETFELLKNDPGFKLTFRYLQGVLEILNLYSAWDKVMAVKVASDKDKAALASAFVDIMKFGTEIVEVLSKVKDSMYSRESDKSVNKGLIKQKENLKIQKRLKKGSRKYKKLTSKNNLSKRLSRAGTEAAHYAARYGQWTSIANNATRILGVFGSAFMYAESAFEFAEQTTTKGRFATVTKLYGKMLFANKSLGILRIILAVRGTATAGTAIMGAGLLTSEMGIGIILMVVGVIVSFVSEALLKDANRPKLIKDLDYCYFGQHPYGDWALFDQNEHDKKENTSKQLNTRGKEEEYTYDIAAELGRIYRDLFVYDGFVAVGRVLDKPNKQWDDYVVVGTIIPSQLIQNKTTLFVNIKLEYDSGTQGKLFTTQHLKIRQVSKDAGVPTFELYQKLTADEVRGLNRVTMSTQLDIDGDGKKLVPDNKKRDFTFYKTIGANSLQWFYGGNKITKAPEEASALPSISIDLVNEAYADQDINIKIL